MDFLPHSICGVDIDDLFAYPTVKYVKIRDARLGLLRYLSIFFIVCYVVVYQICYNTEYLKSLPPIGMLSVCGTLMREGRL